MQTAFRLTAKTTYVCTSLLLAMMGLFILGRGVAEVTLGVIASCFLIKSLVTHDTKWIGKPYILWNLLIWVYLLVQSEWVAYVPDEALQRSLAWPRLTFLLAAMSSWLLVTKRSQLHLGYAVAFCVLFVALDVALQGAVGVDILGNEQRKATRLNGPFDDFVAGSYMVKLLFPSLAVVMIWSQKHADWKAWLWLPFLLTTATGIVLTGERAALLLLPFGITLFALFAGKRLRKTILAGGALMALIGLVIFLSVPGVQERLTGANTMRHIESFWETPYGVIYKNSFQMVKEYPLFGVGMRNYRFVCRQDGYERFRRLKAECGTHPHHTYLELWVETGAVGLALFLVMFGICGYYTWRACKSPAACKDDRLMLLGTSVSIAIFMFPFLPTMSFFANWNAILLWFVLGWHMSITERILHRHGHDCCKLPSADT